MNLNPEQMIDKLKDFGISSERQYYTRAFARNIGLLSPGEQEKLSRSRIAIPGMGGVGGIHLINLIRTGFGRFHLADFDNFEPANINRQSGASVSSFGRAKLEVMIDQAVSINPYLEIKPFSSGLTPENINEFLQGTEVVLDGLDFFQFDIRRLLFKTARKKGIPVITAGPLGYSSALLVFSPDGMDFDTYFDVRRKMPEEEKYLRFAMGLAPRPTHIPYMDLGRVDLKGGAGPSLGIACQLCSALAVTEAVRIVLGKPGLQPVPYYSQFDPFRQKYHKGYLRGGNRSIKQKVRLWYVRNTLLATASKARPFIPERPETIEKNENISVKALKYLVRAAVQAPSGDNAQPWKFRISEERAVVSLFLNPSADNSFFNVHQAASIISCGAALENMRLAAGEINLNPDITLLPDPGQKNLMAEVSLVVDEKSDRDPLAEQIWYRCTNRRPFLKHPLPRWVQDDLKDRIKDIPESGLHMLTSRKEIKAVARLVYQADRIRTEHKDLHEHFSSMIRFSQAEAESTRDGLPLKNLEAGLPGEMFLRATKPWPVMNGVNKIGLGRMVAMHSARSIIASGCVGMVTVSGLEKKDFLKGGQALERIWLTLGHHGLQMQPMTAITLFWLRCLWKGPESFSDKHAKLLRRVWTRFHGLFPEVDFQKQGLVILFRAGYGPGIRHRTLRKDVDDFLLN